MIEQQWIRVPAGVKPPDYAFPVMSELGELIEYRVLQYREVIHGRPSEEFIDGVWTETSGEITTDWIDVPIHEEQGNG